MAYGDGIISAFDTGFQRGNLIRQRRRENEMNRILAESYQDPTNPTMRVESGSPFDAQGNFTLDTVTPTLPSPLRGPQDNVITTPGQPGGFNFQNALAGLYKGGFGKEALTLQQTHEQNEIANLLKRAQAAKALRPEAPTSRQVPINEKGDVRTEEWDATTGTWKPVATGRKTPLVQIGEKGFGKADEVFAKEYIDWKTGGFADTQKSVVQLRDALDRLKTSKEALTGPWVGNIPDVGLQFVNPEAIAVRESIEEVVQRNLRLILGAQFTEKEGERLIARAFNPKLKPEENVSRVERLIAQIEAAANAKQQLSDYFDKHGTIRGFQGKLYTMGDFYRAIEKKPQGATQSQNGHKLGDIVTGGDGKKYRIIKLNPDGDHDVAPVQ